MILRNAMVVTPEGTVVRDIIVTGERIEALTAPGAASGEDGLDLEGFFVFPGFVDAHVHFNEPGRADWEGLESGSRALAAGGGTVFVDMPLNSDPPVLSAADLLEKRRVAERKSVTDFALWGGLCPGAIDAIPAMAEAGAAGFKAFLCPSGISEFPHADRATLRAGMKLAADCGLPVAVHAEDPAIVEAAASRIPGRTFADFLASRPKEAEVEAIRMACEEAGETGATLHVVHVTCAEGLEEVAGFRQAGVRVTAETCPHYLLFDADQAPAIGARAKCAPPLRPAADVGALWSALAAGLVETIGSDHSPAPPSMKTGEDFFKIWGGISGCQHGLVSWLGEWHHRHPQRLAEAAAWIASNPARLLCLGGKGAIVPGFDADLTVVEFGEPADSAPALYRHPAHLYEAFRPRCRVRHVLRRGEFLVRDGRSVATAGAGKFLTPARREN